MIKVEFHNLNSISDEKLIFAVICTEYESKWVWCKNKVRNAWEIPGGKREVGEDILDTAKKARVKTTGHKAPAKPTTEI